MQGTAVRTRLPFCSQKEKREENAIGAEPPSWDASWEERRRRGGAGRRARTERASGTRRRGLRNPLHHRTGPGRAGPDQLLRQGPVRLRISS